MTCTRWPIRQTPTLLLVLVLLAPAALAEDSPTAGQPLPVAPSFVRMGSLDSGLTYWIRKHAMPRDKVTLLLHLRSGSLHEEENQRGLAHFLEHLAFNGSENFAPGEVVRYFESLGMAFGQHQNAFTSFDQTTYLLSLPDTKEETIEKALLFLADVAFRLSLVPEEVEKERAVILEEARARAGVQMRMMEQVLPLLLPGSRLARRIPIGDLDVVREAGPERLRAFYQTWYRPDRATVVAIGDIEADDLEPLIRTAFAAWAASTEAPGEIDVGIVSHPELAAAVVTDPDLPAVQVSITTVTPESPPTTVGDYRRRLVGNLGRLLINRRLQTLLQEGEAHYTEAGMQRGQVLAGYLLGGTMLSTSVDRWRKGLAQVVAEIRRLRMRGTTDAELERAKDALLASLGRRAKERQSLPAMQLAMGMTGALAQGYVPMSATQRRDFAARLLPGITGDEVQKAFAEMIDPSRSLVLVGFPEGKEVVAPSEEEVLVTLRSALDADLQDRAVRGDVRELLPEDPAPGSLRYRVRAKKLGVTSLYLRNGICVHVKPLPDVESVRVRVNLFGGLPEESAGQRGLTEAAANAFTRGRMATRRLSPADVSQYLAPLGIQLEGSMEDACLALEVTGTAADLPAGLRLVHLLLAEPRVDAETLEAWKREITPNLAQLATSLPAQGLLELRRIASGEDVRFALPAVDHYQSITLEATQAWLEHLVQEAPLEVVFAGGISAGEAERLALTWFGSLPPRPDRWAEIRRLRKVAQVPGPILRDREIPASAPYALVLLGWRGVSLDDWRGQLALTQAGTLLTPRLLREVREERGLTYAIGSGYQYTDYEGMDGLLVQFTAAPDAAKEAAQVAKDVVLELVANGPTDEEVLAVERQMAHVIQAQAQLPHFWTVVLGKLCANHRSLSEVSTRMRLLEKVDREALREALRRTIIDERFAEVIVRPEGRE